MEGKIDNQPLVIIKLDNKTKDIDGHLHLDSNDEDQLKRIRKMLHNMSEHISKIIKNNTIKRMETAILGLQFIKENYYDTLPEETKSKIDDMLSDSKSFVKIDRKIDKTMNIFDEKYERLDDDGKEQLLNDIASSIENISKGG